MRSPLLGRPSYFFQPMFALVSAPTSAAKAAASGRPELELVQDRP